MLKEVIEILSECECMKGITSCASLVDCSNVSLFPLKGSVEKTYTDGKTLNRLNAKILYKAPYFPKGDENFTCDLFFENVKNYLSELFNTNSVKKGDYYFLGIEPVLNYVLENKTASSAIYSLEICIYYLK